MLDCCTKCTSCCVRCSVCTPCEKAHLVQTKGEMWRDNLITKLVTMALDDTVGKLTKPKCSCASISLRHNVLQCGEKLAHIVAEVLQLILNLKYLQRVVLCAYIIIIIRAPIDELQPTKTNT